VLLWELSWGKHIDMLKEAAQVPGMPPPKALLSRPALPEHLRPSLSAFYEISCGRMVTEQPQPIQVAEVLAYAQLMGIDSHTEREQLFTIVRALDAAYLTQSAKDRAK